MKKKQESNASRNCGILGIIFSLLVPLVGLILGIIGLSIKKHSKHRTRDIALNVIALCLFPVGWALGFAILAAMF